MEISLLRQVVECSKQISEFIRNKETISLLHCLEERGRLIEDLAALERRRKEAGMGGPREWEDRLSPEANGAVRSLWETISSLYRELAQIDRQNLSSLCAWQEGIKDDLLSMWQGKAITSAYRGITYNERVSVFLDRQK
ncbi:MAG TPA: flagellar protein FlgN [Firmicutes bacterium]|nr:flagellar protein FlgN [Bacillota bacterium]